jgi:hypothetical protein
MKTSWATAEACGAPQSEQTAGRRSDELLPFALMVIERIVGASVGLFVGVVATLLPLAPGWSESVVGWPIEISWLMAAASTIAGALVGPLLAPSRPGGVTRPALSFALVAGVVAAAAYALAVVSSTSIDPGFHHYTASEVIEFGGGALLVAIPESILWALAVRWALARRDSGVRLASGE